MELVFEVDACRSSILAVSLVHRPRIQVPAECLSIVYAFSSIACACRIATLYNEVWYQPVKYCPIVVAVETVLQEIPAGQWRLFGEQLDLDLAEGRVKNG